MSVYRKEDLHTKELCKPYYDQFHSRFVYDARKGRLRYKINVGTRKKKGDLVGHIRSERYAERYVQVTVNYVQWLEHQIVWIMHHGYMPEGCIIDHIDGDGTSNYLHNLRATTQSTNAKNRRVSKRNTSGYPGVHWEKYCKNWRATIRVDGKRVTLGSFKDKGDAIDARREAEVKLGYKNARPKRVQERRGTHNRVMEALL